jgi:hypothetical protein
MSTDDRLEPRWGNRRNASGQTSENRNRSIMKGLTSFCMLILIVILCVSMIREIRRIEHPQPTVVNTCEQYPKSGLSWILPTT